MEKLEKVKQMPWGMRKRCLPTWAHTGAVQAKGSVSWKSKLFGILYSLSLKGN